LLASLSLVGVGLSSHLQFTNSYKSIYKLQLSFIWQRFPSIWQGFLSSWQNVESLWQIKKLLWQKVFKKDVKDFFMKSKNNHN